MNQVKLIFPPIGTLITNEMALQLSQSLGLQNVVNEILGGSNLYRSWYFDGVSGLHDSLMGFIGNGYNVTYQCALPHDLAYGYGKLGDKLGRKHADHQFRENLIHKANVHPFNAYLCWLAVRILGTEKLGLSFTWGFANANRKSLIDRPIKWTY